MVLFSSLANALRFAVATIWEKVDMKTFLMTLLLSCVSLGLSAQSKTETLDKFRQLEEELPTPNMYRNASGAPGAKYWQQRADYKIEARLDDENQRLFGQETITYYNLSPDTLRYLWVQLDQNRFEKKSDNNLARPAPDLDDDVGYRSLTRWLYARDFDGGYKITGVRDAKGKDLPHRIIKTMMRIDLPAPLKPGQTVSFAIDWHYNIHEQKKLGGRSGCEFFEEDGNYIYEIAQWFPRMAAYTDVNGWQHKQFLGSGEFTLEFGDYEVAITAPADHIVASTGVLQNPKEVLSADQRNRLAKAENADSPVLIVTPEEALANEKSRAAATKTWVYKAKNVRDFAFASSRKFIWDAQGYDQQGGDTVMAMSYYPKEGNPLWERYSTESIIHTIENYNHFTFVYPYPVAISVNGPVGGMEYPMICFNGPRPEKDKTYSRRTKYGLISVIIHEVGHNYFPMIVNSDERQWTWMDEGLNTFLQYLTEQTWEKDYPSRRGEPQNIVDYMVAEKQVPIMTNSESLLQFGNNAYAKPATALNILRETILGRELFDFAFREYARRWQFKRPQPADFFRTMEDASGVDLDWFWRGWFYSTDHVDIAIKGIRQYNVNTRNPELEKDIERNEDPDNFTTIAKQRNEVLAKRVDKHPELADFYNQHDAHTVTPADRKAYAKLLEDLEPHERKLLEETSNFFVLDFENIGGLVMPIILKITYSDGSEEMMRIPAEIWRYNHREASKMIITPLEIVKVAVDPYRETADADLTNNSYPPEPVKSRFQLFKRKRQNLMRKMTDKLDPGGQSPPAKPRDPKP